MSSCTKLLQQVFEYAEMPPSTTMVPTNQPGFPKHSKDLPMDTEISGVLELGVYACEMVGRVGC